MILPPFNRLIIDEAHNIESNATEYFTEVYDSQQLLRQISKIQRSGRFRGKVCWSSLVNTAARQTSSTGSRMISTC